MAKRIVELQPRTQKSFYGKAQIYYDDEVGSASLFSYGTFMVEITYGSVTKFNLNEYDYSRTTMKHVNDFLEQHGLDRTNLAEVRLSIKNGEWYDL